MSQLVSTALVTILMESEAVPGFNKKNAVQKLDKLFKFSVVDDLDFQKAIDLNEPSIIPLMFSSSGVQKNNPQQRASNAVTYLLRNPFGKQPRIEMLKELLKHNPSIDNDLKSHLENHLQKMNKEQSLRLDRAGKELPQTEAHSQLKEIVSLLNPKPNAPQFKPY